MKNYFGLFALPALALAAAIDSRDTAVDLVRITDARIKPGDSGNACPKSVGKYFGETQRNITLHLEESYVTIGPNTFGNDRNKLCNYEITVEWPQGCSQTTFRIWPRGSMHMANAQQRAYFHSQNDFRSTEPGSSVTQVEQGGAQYVGLDRDFGEEKRVTLTRKRVVAGEEKVVYELRTRVNLEDGGVRDNTDFGVFSLDFSFENDRKC